ncbi:LuxR C-terminal-related transcriptional regulator [Terrabacter sp. Root85]|uniref:LuxR C-terminal-related transcriptional regulator n=1 Tax=Terrabacter sp. Root85 TaxID=1736603 RepID=UPI0012FB50DD|nr:LuxR C-terminal-related transcriptional regulator [Terrabacter sp. Root85]
MPRPRLVSALDSALERPLTVVAAGAASGKTVLLSEWVRHRGERTAWVSLERDDNTPAAFWALVGESLEEVGLAGQPGSAGVQRPPADEVRELLAATVSDREPLYLVLDDAHVLADLGLIGQLDALVRHPLPGLHILMAARSDPILPLHRYRMDGRLSELRALDLAMTVSEVDDLLRTHALDIAPSARTLLVERTEGWVAALRLSMVRMEAAEEPEAFVTAFAMDRGSIGEFLLEEVLATLDARSRRLLIRTSACEVICGSLADAVCAEAGSALVLERLAQSNSFVSPLPDEVGWYRYHPLMREVLVHLLSSETLDARRLVDARAARWHDGEGNVIEALHHALRAHDWSLAADLLRRGAFARLFLGDGERSIGDVHGLLRAPWSQPVDDGPAGSSKAAARAAVAAATGDVASLRAMLGPWHPAEVTSDTDLLADFARLVLATCDGDVDTADVVAGRMLATDPDGPFGVFARSRIGASAVWRGHEDAAVEHLTAALVDARRLGMTPLALECTGLLGIQHCSLGRVARAEDHVAYGDRLLREHPRLTGRHTAAHFVAAAEVAVTRGRIDEFDVATDRATRALDPEADPALWGTVTLLRAKALQAAGRYGPARSLLVGDRSLSSPGAFNLVAVAQAMAAELASLSGRPERPSDPAATDPNEHLSNLFEIARARAELADGDLRSAERLVRRVITASAPAPALPALVEAVLVGSEVALAAGDERRAVEQAVYAIDLGRSADVVLPFVEAAPRLFSLITRHDTLAERWPVPLHDRAAEHPTPRTGLPESLTDRELSVLRWLTTMMSVAEIADELCVSTNTVKTHVAAVYRKLGVARRRDAVARGRELRLL